MRKLLLVIFTLLICCRTSFAIEELSSPDEVVLDIDSVQEETIFDAKEKSLFMKNLTVSGLKQRRNTPK